MPPADPPLDYRSAGVDVEAGDALVEAIKPVAARTRREGVVDGLGGFGALFELPKKFREPLLVSGTDGVGTKLKLAFEMNRHNSIGIDLVAMCANDVLAQGAEPLFFLDYFATGRLSADVARQVIQGIGAGCEQAGAALIGGETAEMPGMYAGGEYDLAGFCVGAVEKSDLIDGSKVQAGDAVVGLASSGPHSNGYSLIRKVLETRGIGLDAPFDDGTVGEHLLRPTRIYVKPVLALMGSVEVRAIAHITGGGIAANIARVLPPGIGVDLRRPAWPEPGIFQWIREQGGIEGEEMLKTFNCGLGMVLVVAQAELGATLGHLGQAGIEAWEVGRAVARDDGTVVIHE
ncbi:MAG TPA: phosphoribosylformylglycinamidine cyclo-ligase [Arenicellales bacterium]|nr:phosphoribosylformylglycinamidine cyclo-ligase [Arenicellales bacterium]